mgnify:CR=1 FL=1
MYSVKNISQNKSLNGDLVDKFLDFVVKELELDQPFSVYFVDDKSNAKDPLGKTAMYNPKTKSVYVYATNRHPKDMLRSIAHELMHHKQNCEGSLEELPLEDAEKKANEAGYLLRKYEDGLKEAIPGGGRLQERQPLPYGIEKLRPKKVLPTGWPTGWPSPAVKYANEKEMFAKAGINRKCLPHQELLVPPQYPKKIRTYKYGWDPVPFPLGLVAMKLYGDPTVSPAGMCLPKGLSATLKAKGPAAKIQDYKLEDLLIISRDDKKSLMATKPRRSSAFTKTVVNTSGQLTSLNVALGIIPKLLRDFAVIRRLPVASSERQPGVKKRDVEQYKPEELAAARRIYYLFDPPPDRIKGKYGVERDVIGGLGQILHPSIVEKFKRRPQFKKYIQKAIDITGQHGQATVAISKQDTETFGAMLIGADRWWNHLPTLRKIQWILDLVGFLPASPTPAGVIGPAADMTNGILYLYSFSSEEDIWDLINALISFMAAAFPTADLLKLKRASDSRSLFKLLMDRELREYAMREQLPLILRGVERWSKGPVIPLLPDIVPRSFRRGAGRYIQQIYTLKKNIVALQTFQMTAAASLAKLINKLESSADLTKFDDVKKLVDELNIDAEQKKFLIDLIQGQKNLPEVKQALKKASADVDNFVEQLVTDLLWNPKAANRAGVHTIDQIREAIKTAEVSVATVLPKSYVNEILENGARLERKLTEAPFSKLTDAEKLQVTELVQLSSLSIMLETNIGNIDFILRQGGFVVPGLAAGSKGAKSLKGVVAERIKHYEKQISEFEDQLAAGYAFLSTDAQRQRVLQRIEFLKKGVERYKKLNFDNLDNLKYIQRQNIEQFKEFTEALHSKGAFNDIGELSSIFKINKEMTSEAAEITLQRRVLVDLLVLVKERALVNPTRFFTLYGMPNLPKKKLAKLGVETLTQDEIYRAYQAGMITWMKEHPNEVAKYLKSRFTNEAVEATRIALSNLKDKGSFITGYKSLRKYIQATIAKAFGIANVTNQAVLASKLDHFMSFGTLKLSKTHPKLAQILYTGIRSGITYLKIQRMADETARYYGIKGQGRGPTIGKGKKRGDIMDIAQLLFGKKESELHGYELMAAVALYNANEVAKSVETGVEGIKQVFPKNKNPIRVTNGGGLKIVGVAPIAEKEPEKEPEVSPPLESPADRKKKEEEEGKRKEAERKALQAQSDKVQEVVNGVIDKANAALDKFKTGLVRKGEEAGEKKQTKGGAEGDDAEGGGADEPLIGTYTRKQFESLKGIPSDVRLELKKLVKQYKSKGKAKGVLALPGGIGVRREMAQKLTWPATAQQIKNFINKEMKKDRFSFQESKTRTVNDVLRKHKEKELNDKFNKLVKGMTE